MKTIVVSAAVIRSADAFLVTRRQPGVHLSGYWEFPGGKCGAREPLGVCLARELREELGVEVRVGRELLATTYEYPDRRVELHFLACALVGEPAPQLGQEMRWVSLAELDPLEFPPADAELIRFLTNEGELANHGGTARHRELDPGVHEVPVDVRERNRRT